VDPSGLVATNYHVVEDAQEITVTLQDKTLLRAHIFAQAKVGDLALLQVQVGHPVPTLRFGDSDEIRVGDPVLAVGNPLGFGGSVSAGIVSALNRELGVTPFDHFIQTDAAINHGNSGGPLFDMKGEVIGVNTMIVAPQRDGGSVGLGFAIPADSVKFAIDRWLRRHLVNPGWLGVEVQEVTPEIAAALDLGKYSGAVVNGITSGGPAAEARLQVGDVILTFDGRQVTDTRALLRMAARTGVGRSVPLTFWRGGHDEQATVILKTWPVSQLGENVELAPPSPSQQSQDYPLGLALAEANDVWRETYQLASDQQGVVVLAVSRTGAGGDAGLKPGQVILRVEHDEVSTGPEVTRLVEQSSNIQFGNSRHRSGRSSV
jgi:serine protease Do